MGGGKQSTRREPGRGQEARSGRRGEAKHRSALHTCTFQRRFLFPDALVCKKEAFRFGLPRVQSVPITPLASARRLPFDPAWPRRRQFSRLLSSRCRVRTPFIEQYNPSTCPRMRLLRFERDFCDTQHDANVILVAIPSTMH